MEETQIYQIAKRISECRAESIVVLTGAGISVKCGIPDFRSQHGIYRVKIDAMLENLAGGLGPRTADDGSTEYFQLDRAVLRRGIDKAHLQANSCSLLSYSVFNSRSMTTAYYRFCVLLREHIQQHCRTPSGTHHFISKLEKCGRLLRCYTQNIDSIEKWAGLGISAYGAVYNERNAVKPDIPPRVVVQLHGNLHTTRCDTCGAVDKWTHEETQAFMEGMTLDCTRCVDRAQERMKEQKRMTRGGRMGSKRPNIDLYDELTHNVESIESIEKHDTMKHPEILIVFGTSLKTYGSACLTKRLANVVRRRKNGLCIYVNKTKPPADVGKLFHHYICSDCDEWCAKTEQLQIWQSMEPRVMVQTMKHSSASQDGDLCLLDLD